MDSKADPPESDNRDALNELIKIKKASRLRCFCGR